jgi:hypothetical protein
MKLHIASLVGAALSSAVASSSLAQNAQPHGWLGTETLSTPYGEFQFEGGYPIGETAQRLLDMELRNRAIEVYLTNMMAVSERAQEMLFAQPASRNRTRW